MSCNRYGKGPFRIVMIHGGPGACGSFKPVIDVLSREHSILEPELTAGSVLEQIEHLDQIINKESDGKAILVGHGWGAMLAFMYASLHSEKVGKVILISSILLENNARTNLIANSKLRLETEEIKELSQFQKTLSQPEIPFSNASFIRYSVLMEKLNTHNSIKPMDYSAFNAACFREAWPQYIKMRSLGKITKMGLFIDCDVVAIHGDFDIQPVDAIKATLESIVKKPIIHVLENCGGFPWNEKIQDQFFDLLTKEIKGL